MSEITIGHDTPVAINLVAVVSLFLLLATIAALLRIPARQYNRQKLNLSDYTIFLALFFVASLAATQYVSCIIGGVGRPMSTIKGRKYINITVESLKFGWLMSASANTCVRLSMLHLIYTVFWASTFTRRATYVLGTATIMYYLACLIDWAVICRPFNFYWRNDIKGVCGNIQQSMLVMAIFNLILDFLLILIPLPCVWKLKIPTHRKFGVSIVFSMGAVICAITVVRIFTIREFAKPSSKKHWSTTIFPDAVLTSIEPSLGIINASLPLFPALYKRLTGTNFWRRSSSLLSTFRGKSNSSSSSNNGSSNVLSKHESWHTHKNSHTADSGYGHDSATSECSEKTSRVVDDIESLSSPDSFLHDELRGVDMRGMSFQDHSHNTTATKYSPETRIPQHRQLEERPGYHITDVDCGHGFETTPELYTNARL